MSSLWLAAGGIFSGVAAALHVGVILGGAPWYRAFGAGEAMAQLAEAGSSYPARATAAIAIVLAIWSAYGLSGAGLLPKLPLMRLALTLIAAVYLLRGLLAIPVILMLDSPYANELAARMSFMWISSAICLGIGGLYAAGLVTNWRALG